MLTMDSTPLRRSFRQVKLVASAERMPAGHSLSLEWKVVSSAVGVASVQLASAGETGLEMIESIPDQGTRQMIFVRPGSYTFTLTVTFQDGVKRCKQVHVRVES
jgi:hypothetical protein